MIEPGSFVLIYHHRTNSLPSSIKPLDKSRSLCNHSPSHETAARVTSHERKLPIAPGREEGGRSEIREHDVGLQALTLPTPWKSSCSPASTLGRGGREKGQATGFSRPEARTGRGIGAEPRLSRVLVDVRAARSGREGRVERREYVVVGARGRDRGGGSGRREEGRRSEGRARAVALRSPRVEEKEGLSCGGRRRGGRRVGGLRVWGQLESGPASLHERALR